MFRGLSHAEHIFSIIAAVLIGILGAFGAIGFRFLIKLSHRLFFGTFEYSLSVVEAFTWWHKLILPVLGGLLVGPIVYFLAREVRGSGVPEVMEAVARHGGIIRLRVLITKAIAAALTIGSGGSAGREGPIIHIGSAIGSAFGQFSGISPKRLRTFVACGAAAGIAATFNAPIAGALFAVEIILGDFAVAHFSPIVISSVVATVLSRHYIGDFPAFEVPQYDLVSPFEFLPYSILGISAGLISVLFIFTLYRTQDTFDKLKFPEYLKPALGGAIVGLIAIGFPQVYGVGYESINLALWGKDVRLLLLILIFAKLIATSSTLGSGGSGGIFAPSLFIGAMLGALIGEQVHRMFPDMTADVGAYALVGMGAVVAGTTHAPITAILIIFEMTNDYRIIPPLMLSCIVSVLLATYLKKESMYTMKLVRKGINIFEGRDINILRGLTVEKVLSTDMVTIPANWRFSQVFQQLIQSQHDVLLVVNSNKELIGSISLHNLKEFILDQEYLSDLVIAADLAEPPPSILYKTDNLDLVMHQFGRYDVDELPVVKNKNSMELIGIVKRKDVIDAYNTEIFKLDLAGGVHSVVSGVSNQRNIEISKGYHIAEVEPPSSFINRSIRQLNIRATYGLEVVLIHHGQESHGSIPGRPGTIPSPDYVIQPGDRLLVLGSTEDITRFQIGIPKNPVKKFPQ
ncbi:MAG: hypothetical protein Kow0042_16910 [Calditrichia bacterium]